MERTQNNFKIVIPRVAEKNTVAMALFELHERMQGGKELPLYL